MKICGLKVENLTNPLCIERKKPVFGWQVSGEEEGIRQVRYRIRVWACEGAEAGAAQSRDAGDADLAWDSGWVESGRMTCVPYGGRALVSDTRYCWRVEGMFTYGSGEGETASASGESWFETGYYDRNDWKGCFIGETKDHVYHLYRRTFSCGGEVRRAKLYICGLGHFECFFNGNRVSDHVLEPGWTNYDKTCFYTAYDVTELAAEGMNCLLVKLGDGMFHVPGGRYVYYERSYGRSKLLAQLEITYADGRRELVVTDSSWRMAPGPVQFGCIYGGEDYDARLWKESWLRGDYVEEEFWEPAVCVEPPKGRLTAMPMEPMKVMETYAPVSVRQSRPGVWLYDFGRNFSGWVRIKVRAKAPMAGRKIVMRTGEILGGDGSVDQSVTGRGYAWTYILDERQEQEFAPEFTYTGFRYVEMTGAVLEGEDAAEGDLPVLVSMTGEFIYPDVEQAGDFKCSNELFNRIHAIVLQAVKSNTKSYFTDCPHREKLGWLEQTHLIGPSIMYNLNVHNLYGKIEGDMADAQWENGLVPDICPEYVTGFGKWHQGFVDSPEWGSACILNPWYVYKRYGDASLLERYYDTMKRYLDYLGSRTHHEILHHGLGDWLDIGPCTPHSQNTPVPVTATCIYYYDLQAMRQAALLLGKEADAAEYARRMEKVYEEYNLQFYDDQTGRYATGSQTAQAMSLIVGLVPEACQEKVVAELRDDVVKRGYAITAGDVGHPFLVAALMKYGMSHLLHEMTKITETPGYGYQVVNGGTTLAEEWDGPDPKRPHGSQNHLMLGSIEEWFYGSVGGLELMRDDLPFGQVRIAPRPEEGLDWADVWVMHPYGKLAVSWKREGSGIEVTCQVPPNVTAHLEAPGQGVVRTVGSGRHTYHFTLQSRRAATFNRRIHMIELLDERVQRYLTPCRYPQPVLHGSGAAGAFDEKAVDIPFVFWHRGKFHMLYTGFDGIGYQSALAVSDDLLHWTHKGVILKRDMASGRWDRVGGAATWMIKESDRLEDLPRLKKVDGKYWLVYHSYPGTGYESGPAEIGLAWTEDEELLDWHFPDRPCFSWRDGEEWESGGLYKACVIRHEGRWYLFYNAKDREARWTEQTGMAVSDDLLHWTRCGENPVLRVDRQSWDERFVSDPYIVRDGDRWVNFYFGYGKMYGDGHTHAQEGLAFSSDLVRWEKVREPILTYGAPGSYDCGHAHKASVLYYEGTLYHFYCGTCPWQEGYPTNAYGEYRTICLAASRPVWESA